MNNINAAINAIKSMYQMIVAVDKGSMACSVLDCNDAVSHIAKEDSDFSKICERLFL